MTKPKNPFAVGLAKLRTQKLSPERRREIASLAGKARLKKLSPARRKEIARQAIRARWAKVKKQSPRRRGQTP